MVDFREKIKNADSNRKAAAHELAEFLREDGSIETAKKIERGENVHIHEIARCVRQCNDPYLRQSMEKAIERYVEALNEWREYEVKKEIANDFAMDLEYQFDKNDIDFDNEDTS